MRILSCVVCVMALAALVVGAQAPGPTEQGLNDFVRILESGGTLGWMYEKTPYEKVIDPNGITTEYVRCPDPTANLVAKITRTRMNPTTT